MGLKLSDKRKEKLELLCLQGLSGEEFPIHFIAQVIGKIVSSPPGAEFVR